MRFQFLFYRPHIETTSLIIVGNPVRQMDPLVAHRKLEVGPSQWTPGRGRRCAPKVVVMWFRGGMYIATLRTPCCLAG